MTTAPAKASRLEAALWSVAVAATLGFQLWAVAAQSLIGDAPIHLLAGDQALRYGQNTLNIEHPPLVKLVAALAVIVVLGLGLPWSTYAIANREYDHDVGRTTPLAYAEDRASLIAEDRLIPRASASELTTSTACSAWPRRGPLTGSASPPARTMATSPQPPSLLRRVPPRQRLEHLRPSRRMGLTTGGASQSWIPLTPIPSPPAARGKGRRVGLGCHPLDATDHPTPRSAG